MKNKNTKHKNAERRKREANNFLNNFNLQLDSPLINLNIVCNHINNSQINYFLFKAINELLSNYAGFDINIFAEHKARPMMTMLCPVFDIADILTFQGPILTTTYNSCLSLSNISKYKIYHYITNIENVLKNKKEFEKILKHPRIINIVRCSMYKEIIQDEFDFGVDINIYEDFNIRKMLVQIIMEISNDIKQT